MYHSNDLTNQLLDLFTTQPLAVLSTDSDSRPYTSLVAFASSSDLRRLFFATNRDTRKYANLRSNSRVALLVDNRTNRVEDFSSAVAVTVLGDSRELAGAERDDAEGLYLGKHPHLREFVSSPNCALVEVAVNSLYLVSRFQNVTEFHFNP